MKIDLEIKVKYQIKFTSDFKRNYKKVKNMENELILALVTTDSHSQLF